MTETGRVQASGKRHDGGSAPPRGRSLATLALLLLALMLFLDGIAGERGWLANRRAAAEYREAQQALEAAKARNAALREQAWRLKHDPAAIEEAARRQLGLMKKGEKLFIIRDKK
jgi:cell division protein FtsB